MHQQAAHAVPAPDTGSLRDDLIALARDAVANAASPSVDPLVRAAVSELAHSPAVAVAARQFWDERMALDGQIMERAIARLVSPPMELGRRVMTSHGEIAFDVMGDGPPVVLVHGTPSRAQAWRDVVPVLATDHRVYAYDLVGFGDSSRRVDQNVSVARHGEVLAELIRTWRLDEPTLIGHDIGGAAVLRAHLVEGVAVSRIALIDAVVLRPWITDRTRSMQHDAGRYPSLPADDLAAVIREHLNTATVRRLPDDLYGLLFDQWSGADGQALYLRNIDWLDEADTDPLEERLGAVNVPVLVVWGKEDAWLPVSMSYRIADALGAAPPIIIEDAGHFSMLDQPRAVATALRDFLAGSRRS